MTIPHGEALPDSTDRRHGVPGLRELALYTGLALLGLWSSFGGWVRSGFDSSAAVGVDSRLNNYILEHTYRVLLGSLGVRDYVGSLWSPPMFYPAEGTLAYSDNLFGLAPVYWILRTRLEPWTAFQAWVALGFVGTFAAMAWACRRFGCQRVVAAAAGFMFAFGMPRLAQHLGAHDQLVPQVFAPLAIVAGWSFVQTPRHTTLAVFLLLVLWQLVTAIYLGWFLLLGIAAAAPISYLWRDHRMALLTYVRRHWAGAIALVLLWSAAMLAFLLPYLQLSREFGPWGQQYIANTLPRWHSYFRPAPGTPWRPFLRHLSDGEGYHVELNLFVGFGSLALAAVAVWALLSPGPWRASPNELSDNAGAGAAGLRRLCLTLLVAAAALTIATFRFPTGHSLWWHLYEFIPGATSIRSVARIWTVTYLFLVLASAIGVSALLRHYARAGSGTARYLKVGIAVLAVWSVFEQIAWNWKPAASSAFDADVARLASSLAAQDIPAGDVFFVLPADSDRVSGGEELTLNQAHLVAMWASLKTNRPTVNGYSARAPKDYPAEKQVPEPDALLDWVGRGSGARCWILKLEPILAEDSIRGNE